MNFVRQLLGARPRFLAAMLMAAASFVMLSHANTAEAATNVLDSKTNPILSAGSSLTSPNGQFQLIMQTDGNLVAYMWPKAYWSSNKFGSNPHLKLQTDGNLVVYATNGGATGPIWASNQFDVAGARLVLQDDGNMVVIGNSRGLIWSPNAVPTRLYSGQRLEAGRNWTIYSPDRRYRMVMQQDGNVVLYDRSTAIWSKHGKQSNTTLEMQTDGNLVLYNVEHVALWATNKFGSNGSYLEGQNDGNFVVYTPSRAVLWSTRGDTTPDVGGVSNPGSNAGCAAGTTDVGIHEGYASGARTSIRLCALSNLSSTSEESTPGSKYYIAGANGKALVNSAYSGTWYALVRDAKAGGAPAMAASSSFRTMAHQTALYNAPHTSPVAKPGYSNHQMGLAIDFDFGSNTGSPTYKWLVNNAGKYGIKNLPSEAWHWSTNGR